MAKTKPKLAADKTKALSPKRRKALFVLLALLVVAAFGSYKYRQHYDSQLVTINGPGGSSVTETRSQYDKDQKDGGTTIVDGNSLHACENNSKDQCLGAPSIDFYPSPGEGASNPDFKGYLEESGEIMGRIVQTKPKAIVLKTSSGRLFTIEFPINDPIANFNSVRTDTQAAMGDMIYVRYTEKLADTEQDGDQTVPSTRLISSSLIIKAANYKANPNAPVQKY